MENVRTITKLWKSKPTVEGAGVHLKRAFGYHEAPQLDPFLLLDDFRSANPAEYLPGFPWHPHRGIETITYMLDGEVEHGDSMGNRGTILSGDVQWMTAGSGIIHQEMPKGDANGLMGGFQLWANLPASHKMMAPRYRDVKSRQIPEVFLKSGATVRIICGQVNGVRGPVEDIVTDPEYLDVFIPPNARFTHPAKKGHTVFAYVVSGAASFDGVGSRLCDTGTLVLYGDGDSVAVATEAEPVRFLFVSGKPIGEPVAWRGPIVMNTQEELQIAFEEYEQGTFIKHQ
ncbi:Quercetin 2,3-dioxygenase [Rhodocyclaceae bacterium]|nr:Quercetin 2,3-dioxygenase [Rhodocyclaceae bacterium]